jgi:hypothetical protein
MAEGDLPPLIAQASRDELIEHLGPKEPSNPAYVAHAWLDAAMSDDTELFEALCADPTVWDAAVVREMLGEQSGLASRVHPALDRPDEVVNMAVVVDFTDQAVVVHEPTPTMAYNLVLVRGDDATWRVWRLGGERANWSDVHPVA